jgi:methanogenic corrinoid protein MtbC1
LELKGPASRAEVGGSETLAVERELYLQALRKGDPHTALTVATEALADGASVHDVYVDVLQPAQYAIGQEWEWNRITVAKEQIATSITHSVMTRLHLRPHVWKELGADGCGRSLQEAGALAAKLRAKED